MYLHSSSGVMKKHTREQIADWIKENQLHTRQKTYEANHPIEVEKRKKSNFNLAFSLLLPQSILCVQTSP